jgi:hypothetical protein
MRNRLSDFHNESTCQVFFFFNKTAKRQDRSFKRQNQSTLYCLHLKKLDILSFAEPNSLSRLHLLPVERFVLLNNFS